MDFQTIYHVIVTNWSIYFNMKNCEFYEDETRNLVMTIKENFSKNILLYTTTIRRGFK